MAPRPNRDRALIAFHAPTDMKAALEAEARRNDRTVSGLLRQLVRAHLVAVRRATQTPPAAASAAGSGAALLLRN